MTYEIVNDQTTPPGSGVPAALLLAGEFTTFEVEISRKYPYGKTRSSINCHTSICFACVSLK